MLVCLWTHMCKQCVPESMCAQRFKLKTPFLTMARDQIRGGIWYKVREGARGRSPSHQPAPWV